MVSSPKAEPGRPGAGPVADADVLLVGCGPVGQVLALLLAGRGWRVVVAEQWAEPYPMPRAVTFDGHAARIIAAAGAADVIAEIGEPTADYVVCNGAGQPLLRIGFRKVGRHGWPDSTSIYQPGLEAALAVRGALLPGLRVLRGRRVVDLAERGEAVEAVTEDAATGRRGALRARWAVGCDGANSFVRGCLGTSMTDFGFAVDWMACDVTPARPADFPPSNLQVADPRGPRVAVSAGPGHRRWEFMRPEGEPASEFGTLASAWRRLGEFGVTPDNATLDRHAMYSIRALCADRWRSGRILIAGDAAHQMPPFAGQGLCAGLRDAANLAWKLDLVLSGGHGEALLDSYEQERKPNVARAIRLSVWLGSLICQSDRAAAAARDAAMLGSAGRAGGAAPELPDTLTAGLVHAGPGGARADAAGTLLPQARIGCGARTGWFDQIVGPGFALLVRDDPAGLLDPALRAFLRGLRARVVRIVPAGAALRPGDVADLDGVYLPWLDSMRALGALVRPDFYLFGVARDPDEVAAMVAGLRSALPARAGRPERMPT